MFCHFKVIVIASAGVMGVLGLWAQGNHVMDSLTAVLNQLPDDSTRIAFCLDHARDRDADIGVAVIELGQQIALRKNDLESWAKLTSEAAILANIQGDHEGGVKLFEKTDSVYQILRDSSLRAGAQTNIGLSYYHAGLFDQALAHYFEAYKLHSGQPPSQAYSRLLNNLAMCLKHTDRPEEARSYYLQSIAIKKELGDSLGYAHTYHNLALLLSEQGDSKGAIASFDTAAQYYQFLDRTDDEAATHVALGKALMDAGQYERALDYLRSGYRYFKRLAPDSREFQLAAGEMAAFEIQYERWSDADRYIDEALALMPEAGGLGDHIGLLEQKAMIGHHLGRNDEAYDALKQAMILRDTFNSEQRMSLIEEMQTRFNVREKENTLQLTQIELDNQQRVAQLYRSIMIIAIIVAGIIGLLGFVIYRSRQEIKRNKVVIEKALAEKEVLLKEIHHRVKNNLQVISSLLAMQQYQSRDPNVADAMREGQARVHSMALIHQSLYQQESGVELDAGAYVSRLVDSLKKAYRTDSGRIEFVTDVDQINLDVDTMIPLGLILNELITNALKYAFPDARKGVVRVSLRKRNGVVSLRVKDDGIGIRDTEGLRDTNSMGYTLIQDFCRKLRASMDVDGSGGTDVLVKIPLQKTV